MKIYSYNLGTGVKYDESQKGLRLPVQGIYSVKDIFPDAHAGSKKIKTGFQRNTKSSEDTRNKSL